VPISLDTPAPCSNPDLWLYRDRTVALLRRYMRLSIEVGRMPSLLGREFFRTRVTSYGATTFEDSVIFVHDVERSLEELNELEKKLIAKIVLQQFSKEEAGRLLGCGYRTIERLFPEALDRVSEILLKRGILTGLPRTKREVPKSCQEGKNGPFLASD
jgi:DNA-directed RNA polymerase specialized sigma24 family protein